MGHGFVFIIDLLFGSNVWVLFWSHGPPLKAARTVGPMLRLLITTKGCFQANSIEVRRKDARVLQLQYFIPHSLSLVSLRIDFLNQVS